MSGLVARQIRVSGLVQGVGFRAALQDQARHHDVRGWVRNRSDGTVEALLHGTPEAVASVIAWVRHGPRGARVADVRVRDAAAENPPERFELRPTL